MNPIQIPESERRPGEQAVVIGGNQLQIADLPGAIIQLLPSTPLRTLWELTEAERVAIMFGARIELVMLTYGGPPLPVRLAVSPVPEDNEQPAAT